MKQYVAENIEIRTEKTIEKANGFNNAYKFKNIATIIPGA